MFKKLGDLVARRYWWFLALWPLLGLLIIWLCPNLSRETREGMSVRLPDKYESHQVARILATEFTGYEVDSCRLAILLHRKDGLLKKDFRERIPKII